MPGRVLSMEGLGSALWGTRPARIVRWVAPPTSKRTPPARAAQQLVPARSLAFGFALLRRACICFDRTVRLQDAARTSLSIGVLVLSCSLLDAGSVHVHKFGSNRCGLALAASEAVRTARADAARDFDELARPCFRLTAWPVRAFDCRTLQVRGTFIRARPCIPAMPNV